MKIRFATGSDGRRAIFWCPGCDHPHSLRIEGANAWQFNDDVEKPTLNPSILCYWPNDDSYRCHSFVRDGKIQFLDDCTHELKGQTVDLPEWPYDDYGGLDPL